MAKRRQLLTSEDAKPNPKGKQHKHPCSDCPFARAAFPGWLGGFSANYWMAVAHIGHSAECHTTHRAQCAGLAIYRANVCKQPPPEALELPADREAVFATPMEFIKHHGGEERFVDPEDLLENPNG